MTESQPGVRPERQLLHPVRVPRCRLGYRRLASGALVLQKYNFNGSRRRSVNFTNNAQTPNPYGGGFGFGFGGGSRTKIIYQWYGAGHQ